MTLATEKSAAPTAPPARPLIPVMRVTLYSAALLVAGLGVDLFFFPELTQTLFAWTITPVLSAAFLGANYLAATIVLFGSARQPTWDRARVVVPAAMFFTLFTAILTLLNIRLLNLHHPITWIWIAGYFGVPPMLGIAWWMQKKAPGNDPTRRALPRILRAALLLLSLVLLVCGTALAAAPERASPFWPWRLPSGYSLKGPSIMEAYVGVWLLAWGILILCAAIEHDLTRARSAFTALIALALLHGIAIYRFGEEANLWRTPRVYAYVGVLAVIGALGLWGRLTARQTTLPVSGIPSPQ